MTFSALDSGLTGPLFASDAMCAVFSDAAHLTAMLAVETALARAQARVGLVPRSLAPALARIKADDLDIAALGMLTRDAGVVAIPFVKAIEALLPEKLRAHVHKGATSQDIVDTALVLQMADALSLIAADLVAIIDGLSLLTRKHARSPCVGRTYGQHAAPVTFGYVAGTWMSGICDVAADLPALRDRTLVASLGGPVGTLAGLGAAAEAVSEGFAHELGLGVAPVTWHTSRARMVAVGSWLATLIATLARMATDVVFMSATEVGEVREASAEGRGGSSAMPHKQNPLSSAVILSAQAAAPGPSCHACQCRRLRPAAPRRPVAGGVACHPRAFRPCLRGTQRSPAAGDQSCRRAKTHARQSRHDPWPDLRRCGGECARRQDGPRQRTGDGGQGGGARARNGRAPARGAGRSGRTRRIARQRV